MWGRLREGLRDVGRVEGSVEGCGEENGERAIYMHM